MGLVLGFLSAALALLFVAFLLREPGSAHDATARDFREEDGR